MAQVRACDILATSGKTVSGTFCAKHPKGEFLAKGTRHLFSARSLIVGFLIAHSISPKFVKFDHRGFDFAAAGDLREINTAFVLHVLNYDASRHTPLLPNEQCA